MKSTLYNLLTFFLLSGCMLACTDEDYSNNTGSETQEQSVKIKLSIQSEATQTRSQENILPEEKEDAIKNLQLFIFRRDGEQVLVKEYYFDQWTNKQIIEAYTGRFIYVLVANMHEEWIGITKYNDISNKLYNITSESDISTGEALAAVFNKELLIPYPPVGSDVVELKDGTEPISLKRLTSKVILNLQIDGTTAGNEPLRNKLNIKSVQMKNASKSMYIFNENAPLDEITTEVLHYPIRTFDANNGLNSIDDAFYILERKAADSRTLGTYVEIKAEYRDINSSVPTKLVTYKASFNTEPFENNNFQGLFNVSRNQKYMLNVKIMGTNEDDIRVDVEELHRGGVFVDQAATGRGTGASWEDAFPTISEAIAFATEYNSKTNTIRKIYVKEGIYQENIIITDGLNVMGGFASNLTGTNTTDRNYTQKPIISPSNQTTNKAIVTFSKTLTQPTSLSYFIVQDGAADMGAGVIMEDPKALLYGCRIRNNKAQQYGAGVYISAGEIWNCIIDNNESQVNGAGVYITNTLAEVRIQNSTIVNNHINQIITRNQNSILFNQPSSGIYAVSGAEAIAHHCIIHNNTASNGYQTNYPSGVKAQFCAYGTDEILSWDEITNANIRIVLSSSAASNQPFITEINTPGFKSDNSYELADNSPLLSRGYVGKKNSDWEHLDYNGKQAKNKKFPDLGAIQGQIFRPYLDVYLNKLSFLPSIGSSINGFIASNIIDNCFSSSTLEWAVQPSQADYYKSMPLSTRVANNSKENNTLTGSFINTVHQLRLSIPQEYINFEIYKPNTSFNLQRNLYLMPTGSGQNTSLELFTHNPIEYVVDTKITPSDRSFKSLINNGASWFSATESNDIISFKNDAYRLPVNTTSNHIISQTAIGFKYAFKDSDTDVEVVIKPFPKDQFIQVPEWILGETTTISALGLTENDLYNYFEAKALPTWQFNTPTLNKTSKDDGKANTAEAINQILSADDYNWDTISETNYRSTLSNVFIFCASIDPIVREKLITKTNITAQDLTWYVPSINELKFLSIFGNGALDFALGGYYYISSTFGNNYLRRFNIDTYEEWQASSTIMEPGYIRCIRNTNAPSNNNALYGGVAIVDSLGSYIIRSEGMYSNHIISGLPVIPNETNLVAKFEIHPEENATEYTLAQAEDYCTKLGNDQHGQWRLPTPKEIMLIHLCNEKLTPTIDFESMIPEAEYFVMQQNTGFKIKVFEFGNGELKEYSTPLGRVRCVRSIK